MSMVLKLRFSLLVLEMNVETIIVETRNKEQYNE